MRLIDASIVLIGTMLGFGALVMGLATGSIVPALPFLVLALAVAAVGGVRMALTQRVLLVANPYDAAQPRLRAALDDEGFAVRCCAGPTYRDCPLLSGHACPVGRHQVAVVVSPTAGYTGPAPLCGLALGVPWLTVEPGSDAGPAVGQRAARVGAAQGSGTAAATVHTLLEHAGARSGGGVTRRKVRATSFR